MRHFIGAQDQDTIVTFFAGKSLENPLVWRLSYQNPPDGWLPSSGRRHHSTTTPPSSRENLQKKRAFRLTRIVNYPIGITFLVCYNRYMDMKIRRRYSRTLHPRPFRSFINLRSTVLHRPGRRTSSPNHQRTARCRSCHSRPVDCSQSLG